MANIIHVSTVDHFYNYMLVLIRQYDTMSLFSHF